jgi:hypothetical protein
MNLQERIVKEATEWIGEAFNPGVKAQCAEWVSTVLDAAGVKDQGYHHSAWVPDYKIMGKRVGLEENRLPGDILIFDNTYIEASSTHIGIFIGGKKFIHRSTSEAPVKEASLGESYWNTRLAQVRRFEEEAKKKYDTIKIFVNENGKHLIMNGKEYDIVSFEAHVKVAK